MCRGVTLVICRFWTIMDIYQHLSLKCYSAHAYKGLLHPSERAAKKNQSFSQELIYFSRCVMIISFQIFPDFLLLSAPFCECKWPFSFQILWGWRGGHRLTLKEHSSQPVSDSLWTPEPPLHFFNMNRVKCRIPLRFINPGLRDVEHFTSALHTF